MERKGKRPLALLLIVVMVLSLLPAAALADEPGRDATHIQQGESLYYDEKGKEVTDSDAWVVRTEKTAKTTTEENRFKITLTVQAKDIEQIVKVKEPVYADAILVFDVSGSMDSNQIGGVTRWAALKAAANTFIDNFLTEGTGNRVAIAIYGGSSSGGSANKDYRIIREFTSDASAAKASYNYSSASNMRSASAGFGTSQNNQYTNCQAGYRGAQELLGSANNELKYVVYMSDGEANRCYSIITGSGSSRKNDHSQDKGVVTLYSTSSSSNNYYNGGGSNGFDAFCAEATIEQLKVIKDSYDVTIYAIGFSADAANSPALSNAHTIYKAANDPVELAETYKEISDTIKLATSPWTVSDLMGPNVIYQGLVEENSNAMFDGAKKELIWDVGAEADANPGQEEYILSYYVTLNMSNLGIWGKDEKGDYKFNLSNGDTRLTYRIVTTDDNDKPIKTDYAIVEFDIPRVAADIYTITHKHYLDESTDPFHSAEVKGHIGSDPLDLDAQISTQAGITFVERDLYNTEGAVVAFNSDNDGVTVKYYYTTGQPLKIRYGYMDGDTFTPLAGDYDAVVKTGHGYSVDSPAIAGWHLKEPGEATVSGTMPNHGVIHQVIYERDEYKVTYEFSGSKPDGAVPPTDAGTYYYDDTVTVKPNPTAEGWTFNGWKIGGEPAGSSFAIKGNTTIVGTWTIKNYSLDEVYRFADEDDLEQYRESLKDEEGNYGDSPLGTFHANYKGMANVFVRYSERHDHGYSYEFTPAELDDFKTNHVAGANPGTLKSDTIVVFELVNDLFTVKVNHYKEVKSGTSGAVSLGGKYYLFEETVPGGSYNSGASYDIEEQDYRSAGYTLNDGISDELTGYVMGTENAEHDLYYDIAKYTAEFSFVGASPEDISEPGDQENLWHGIDKVTDPAIAVPAGWSFNGWYTDEELTQRYDFGTAVTDDVQLYGEWTRLTYNVNFAFVGSVPEAASVPGAQTGMYYGDFVTEPDSTNYNTAYDSASQNYTFQGWFTESIGGTAYDFDAGIVESHTVYGRWIVETIQYPFTVEHYVDGEYVFTTDGTTALNYGTVISDTAAASYKVDASDSRFKDELGHNYVTFVNAAGVTIKDVVADNVVKCYYETNKYNLTIHYVYVEDNSLAGPSHNSTVTYGKDYSVSSPSVAHYTAALRPNDDGADLTGLTVSGTMPARDVELTVVYTPFDQYRYYIDYYWVNPDSEEEVSLLPQYSSLAIYDGDAYAIDAALTSGKTIPGYTYKNTVGDTGGTMTENVYVKVYFTKDTATLNVRYVDDSDPEGTGAASLALAASNRSETLYAGGAYTANAAPAPSGYKLVAIDYPAGAEREGNTVTGVVGEKDSVTEIVYHYAPLKSASVRVEYWQVDKEGTKLGDMLSVKPYVHKEGDNYDVSADRTDTYGDKGQYTFHGDSTQGVYAGGPLGADQSVTVELYYTLNDYAFTVKYVNGRTGQEIGEPRQGSAPYGTVMTNGIISDLLDDEGWVNARRPSGYRDGTVSATITIGTDPEKNVIIVTYNRSGGGGDPDPKPPIVNPPVPQPEEPTGVLPEVDKPDDTGVAGEVDKLPQTGGISTATLFGLFGILLAAGGGTVYIKLRRRSLAKTDSN